MTWQYVNGQWVELVPTGYCQCVKKDYLFIVCRFCGLTNPKVKVQRFWKI